VDHRTLISDGNFENNNNNNNEKTKTKKKQKKSKNKQTNKRKKEQQSINQVIEQYSFYLYKHLVMIALH
jgi:prophage tail gpP-like protein